MVATAQQRNLHQDPLWRKEDLGKPIPDAVHATSMALPLWRHVVGYEEKDPAVLNALACGYPRFVFHPYVKQLFDDCLSRFGRAGEIALAFPSRRVAERCLRFVYAKTGAEGRAEPCGAHDIFAVLLPAACFDAGKRFWQHFGEIVSSRQAQAALEGRSAVPAGAKLTLRERLARFSGMDAADVFLYPTGIAALAEAHRMLQACAPNLKSVQAGFPYVDVLKVQTETAPGVHFFPSGDAEHIGEVEALLARERVSGVICEFAGNPLLTSVDVLRLAGTVRQQGVPLVVDETLGTYVNVDLRTCADAIVTSLTKYVAGAGDVMAGSLTLNGASPFHDRFAAFLRERHEDLLWEEDASVLETYARDFPERMQAINRGGEQLADFLAAHPKVERLYYPKYTTPRHYEQVHRPGGGFGGLLSIVLKNADASAPRFYDALRVNKGPSLGTNFTLACPYTLLAHYGELEQVEALGVSRNLIRVSVGLEPPEDLLHRFEEALAPI
ncbi:MAG: PLP-dependent transferase [Candidatus Hydrogenedentes bacterium]|nr:PLP-dependent transferase [Candidatus Hydrogenedentota bacterium]